MRFSQQITRTSNDIELLKDILPVDNYKVRSMNGTKKNFEAVVICKQKDPEDVIRALCYNIKRTHMKLSGSLHLIDQVK